MRSAKYEGISALVALLDDLLCSCSVYTFVDREVVPVNTCGILGPSVLVTVTTKTDGPSIPHVFTGTTSRSTNVYTEQLQSKSSSSATNAEIPSYLAERITAAQAAAE